jgi:hypothetical protein
MFNFFAAALRLWHSSTACNKVLRPWPKTDSPRRSSQIFCLILKIILDPPGVYNTSESYHKSCYFQTVLLAWS